MHLRGVEPQTQSQSRSKFSKVDCVLPLHQGRYTPPPINGATGLLLNHLFQYQASALGWAQKKIGKGHSCIWHCTFSLEHGGAGKKTPQKEKEKKKKTFAPLPGNWIVRFKYSRVPLLHVSDLCLIGIHFNMKQNKYWRVKTWRKRKVRWK
jgi:hypothetical protein